LENLCNLLFELSNEDRLRILHQLNKKAMNVTNLSKTLGLTTQESSRHVSRLGDVGLTEKDVDGLHRLTPYGELALKQLKGLEFISQHSDYFTSHTLARIPPEFVCRIGDLVNSTHVDDVMAAFYNVDKVFREAEEYIWVITKIKESYRAKDMETARRARITGLLEERILERLDICLYMSEKEVAGVAFPFPDGRFDYLGFTATDERSHKLCRDLFQYYWERARSRANVAEELYRRVKKRPKAFYALKKIAARKEIVNGKELILELESMGLIKQGKLTKLGDLVYARLQQ